MSLTDRIFSLADRQIITGASISLAVRVSGLGAGLLAQITLSRILGITEFGQYALILSWCLLLVAPAKFGMDNTVLKFGAGYWQEGDLDRLSALTRYVVRWVLIIGSIIALSLITISAMRPQFFGAASLNQILIMCGIITVLALLGTLSPIFRAALRIFYSQVFEQVARPLATLLLIAGAVLVGIEIDLETALLITLGAGASALILAIIFLRSLIFTAGLSRKRTSGDARNWLTVSWPIFAATLAGELFIQGNTALLGSLAAPEEVARFAAAARLGVFVTFALAALNSITAPMIASAWSQNDRAELLRIVSISARIALILGLLVCLFFVVFGRFALGLFGEGFADGYTALLIILSGGLAGAAVGPVGYVMSMTNLQKPFLYTSLMAASLSVAVSLILIPEWGVVGAAIGMATGAASLNIMRFVYVLRKTGINTSFLARSRPAE